MALPIPAAPAATAATAPATPAASILALLLTGKRARLIGNDGLFADAGRLGDRFGVRLALLPGRLFG